MPPERTEDVARVRWGPEHLFAGLLASFGLIFVLALPPGQGADEPSHYARVYHVSEGHLFPQMIPKRIWGGGDLPASVQRTIDACFYVGNNAEVQVDLGRLWAIRGMRVHPERRLAITYPTAAHYSFVPYLPSAAAVRVARTIGLRMLPQFYIGRLMNLTIAVIALFWAIRIVPVFKLVFGMTALLPIAVQQCATYSPDAPTLSAAVLLTAWLLRLALDPDAIAGKGTVIALAALTGWLTLCKFPYVVLLLLYGVVPVGKMGGWKKYLGLAAMLGLVVVCCLPLIRQGRQYVPNRMIGRGATSIDTQMETIRQDPLHYAQVLGATVADHGALWIEQLGHLGWQETRVNRLPLQLYLLVLVLVALAEGTRMPDIPTRLRLTAGAVCILGVALIVTACYICGSTPDTQIIYGPQGRYFLPLLPLALLTISGGPLRIEAEDRFLRALAGASAAGIALVAAVTVIRRYYIRTDLELRISPLALAAALAMVAGVLVWTARRTNATRQRGLSR